MNLIKYLNCFACFCKTCEDKKKEEEIIIFNNYNMLKNITDDSSIPYFSFKIVYFMENRVIYMMVIHLVLYFNTRKN
jgi:hypothetical protein